MPINPHSEFSGDPIIPSPRPAPDDGIESLGRTGSEQAVWWYDQKLIRSGERRFSGHINTIGGTEGDRLRSELSAVTRDLLTWAAQQATESSEDGEAA
ncbi:hypothetical protein [Saccharopolyspora pogona]|uniref:hypothetical protein n=1 Tax=Saccharopolyspora pogona TaxID=333966 RepID=UPI001682EF2F|nr:hypothetical protein [Saccharopolyspora pogona]